MGNNSSENLAKERLYESLSAIVDGQASDVELSRVLDEMLSDADLRNKVMRYQRIGDAIRRENNHFASVDLTGRISHAIEREPVLASKSRNRQPSRLSVFINALKDKFHWSESIGKPIIAASVFFTVILGTRSYMAPHDNLELVADRDVLPSTTTLIQPIQVNRLGYAASGIRAGYSTTTNSQNSEDISQEQLTYARRAADNAAKERFRAYALQHAGSSMMTMGQGLLPFARLTSFDVQ